MIYEYAFPSDTMQALKCLGFRNPHMESPCPNVAITLPAAALMDLYKSNPAGESRGRFWRPVNLLAVCHQMKDEAWSVWGKLPITCGVSISFRSQEGSSRMRLTTPDMDVLPQQPPNRATRKHQARRLQILDHHEMEPNRRSPPPTRAPRLPRELGRLHRRSLVGEPRAFGCYDAY